MEKNDEENELGPTGESNNSQETDEGGDTNNNSDSSSDSSEQGNGFYENLSSESSSTVVVSEDIQTVDQDREGIDQDELERAIEKELEEGVKVISKYLDEESEFIKAYQEMVGKERALDEVRELEGEGCKMTDEEWEKEVKNATYNAELIYESMEKTEIKPINEEIPENKEDLEIEKEVEQSEEISEPQLSDLKEDVREQEKELEQIYEGREPPLEQHQVEPFIKEALETVPEPIINEKEAEKLQELDIEEQFETVHLNEYVDELVEKEELEAEQLKEQVEKEELEAQTSKIKEANSELYEVVEVERDGLDQHEVEATIEEELKTEPEPIINEKEVEKLQELDIEEQFEMAHLNEFVDELVERQDEDKNVENDKIEQEKENIEQTQDVINQSTYLQEKLEEQEEELEWEYEEKDIVEQHQVEAAIEEELKTEPKPIVNEEELEYIKNLEPEKQLEAEVFYEFIEELANKQYEEKEECEEKEEHEDISTEQKVAQIMRELDIPQEINSGETEVEIKTQEGELEQETTFPDEEVVEKLEIEESIDHQQELEEILEQVRKIEQEAFNEIEQEEKDLDKTIIKNYERVKKLYKQQTGKRPIYANKETKGFKQWLEQKKKSEEKKNAKQKKELKEKQKKEEIWKWSLKNWIERATEIDPELKSELRKLVEEYDELEKLIKKYSQLYNKAQHEKLSQAEKNELKSLIKALQKIDPIKIELFLGIREIKRYLDEQYYSDFWDKPRVNRIRHHFFTQLSKIYKSLKQAQKNKKNSEEILKNWIEQMSEEEISPELKTLLKEIVENYSELEELATIFMELYKKEQLEQISQSEKVELKSLIKTLEKLDLINIVLFANIRVIRHYLNDQNFDYFYDKTRVNRTLNHFYLNFFQKYKNLPCNNLSGFSNKRIKIDPLILRKIYNKFQENGITIKKVEQYTNIHSSNIFHRENTISQISFFKLAFYMNKELGYNSIFDLFGQQEIPHEVYLGTRQEISIKKDGNSAELIAILLGDGHLSKNNRHVSITLNSIDEERYVDYVKKLLNRFFPNCFFDSLKPNSKAISIQSSSKYVHYALIKLGLIAGNKVENQVGCPPWLFQEETTITGALKGLFDTDGSIVLDKTYNHLILRFTSGSKPLTEGFKQLCDVLNIKTGKIIDKYSQPDPRTGKIYRIFWVQIASLNHIKKFFQKIKPEKLLDPYRCIYIGTTMIFETIFPNHIKSNSIHNKIYQDFPNNNDRLFTKNFALYLKSLTEKVLIKNKFKTVAGIPFSGKITKQMIDKALILSYTKRKIIISKDNSKIHQIRNNLKLEICKIISEIIIGAKSKLNNLEILNDLDNTLLKINHPELLLKLENPVIRNLLRNYFSNLINYIQELKKNSKRTTKTPIYKINKIYGLGDREGYQIYRFLKKTFPLVFQ